MDRSRRDLPSKASPFSSCVPPPPLWRKSALSGKIGHRGVLSVILCVIRTVGCPVLLCLVHKRVCDVPNSVALGNVNIVRKPSNSPTQGQPTKEKLGEKWHMGHFFPQQIVFRGLGLALYRKQTTRNLTQPNSPRTPYYATGTTLETLVLARLKLLLLL